MNLTQDKINAGAKVLEALDKSGMDISSAFWIRLQDADKWKLGICAKHHSSPRSFYLRIQTIMSRSVPNALALDELLIIKPDAPLLKMLKSMVKTGREISGISFINNTVNGTLLPDMYIYRNT